jgi:hypothetical protein
MGPVLLLLFNIFPCFRKIPIKQIKKGNEIEGFFACLKKLPSTRPGVEGDTPIGKGHLVMDSEGLPQAIRVAPTRCSVADRRGKGTT